MPITVKQPKEILVEMIGFLAALQSSITDFTKYSPVRILYEAFAMKAGELWWALKQVELSAFIRWASGADLDTKVAERGLVRRTPSTATGTLLISREETAVNQPIRRDIARFMTDDGIIFIPTEEETWINVGESTLLLPIEAASPGDGGNVAANAITILLSSHIPRITITNPTPTSGGASNETDASLRLRGMNRLGAIARGAKAAYEEMAVDAHPNVVRALATGQIYGINSVLVTLVGSGGDADGDAQAVVLEALQDNAGLTDEVFVESCEFVTVNVVATITRRPGYTDEQVRESVGFALRRFLDWTSWGWGDDVVKADLVAAIENAAGVLDVETSTMSPASSVIVGARQLPRLGSVTLTIRRPS